MNPYQELEDSAFWKTAVLQPDLDSLNIYQSKFVITHEDKIATAGSCFAQHVARHLSKRNCNFIDVEPAPFTLPLSTQLKFGYSQYSARYGNIYTTRQLLQLAERAIKNSTAYDDGIWEKGGRFYDAYRPGVEPNGLRSPEEVHAHRNYHLIRVKKLFCEMDYFIFTLGLTETWEHRATSTIFPTCPGVIAGKYDKEQFRFVNLTQTDVVSDLISFINLIKGVNPDCRYIFTVSPIPLTATASGQHILVANNYSKSTLRSAAADIVNKNECTEYFPSYELVTNPVSRGIFYSENARGVRQFGVNVVMEQFFGAHPALDGKGISAQADDKLVNITADQDDVACEEALLGAFK